MKNYTINNFKKTVSLLNDSNLLTEGDNVENIALNVFAVSKVFNMTIEEVISEWQNKETLRNI